MTHAHRFFRLTTSALAIALLLGALGTWVSAAAPVHRVILQGNDKLAELKPDGEIAWQWAWGGIHDLHRLPNGHLLLQQGGAKVVELDPATGMVVWQYDSAQANGNAGRKVEVHALQPLPDERVMIAESGRGRIIEVDRSGKIVHELKLKIDHPHPHTDTRLARKLASGNYLVCHEGDGTVREYAPDGSVVWEYEVPLFGKTPRDGHGPEAFGNKCFAAVRLANGHTLISTGNGHGVLEVTPEKKVVWQLEQRDLPGITLAWVTTIEVLPNGNYVIGNCHAGPGQPVLVEIEPATKKVSWQLDGFDRFGNSVSNSQLLDAGTTLR